MTAAACSSSSNPTSVSAAPSIAGTWTGNVTVQGQQARMQWTLTQNGSVVDGNVLLTEASGLVLLNARLAGTLSGQTLSYGIDVVGGSVPSQPACTGRFTGTAVATLTNPATMTGNYTLATSTCTGPVPDGNFVLTRP